MSRRILYEKQKTDANTANEIIIEHENLSYKLNQENKTAELFRNDSDRKDILIPTYIEHEGIQYFVTSIFKQTFKNCKTIRSIQFPADSKLIIIGSYAFNLSTLETISIPSSVEQIQSGAFSICEKLKEVKIPNESKLRKISNCAFSRCPIEKIFIPPSVIRISRSAFENCSYLKEVHIPPDSKLEKIKSYAFSDTIIESLTIPSSFQVFDEYSLYNCSKLKNIEIPLNTQLKKIGRHAFSSSLIESISIPTSVELMDNWCSRTSKLIKVNLIPRKEKNIGYYKNKFIIGKTNPKQDNFNVFLFAPRNTKSFRFPSFITEIKEYSFSDSSIQYLFISDQITHIPELALKKCNSLNTIEFSPKSQLNIIDNHLFGFLPIGEKISIPSTVTSIGVCSFIFCKNLKKVEILPNSQLKSIKALAFDSSSIESFCVPPSVEEINQNAFKNCRNLQIIEFPNESFLNIINEEYFSKSLIIMIEN